MIVIVLPDITTEDELLARVRRGERRAIRQVYQAYFPPLYQFVRLRVDEGQTAEDIVSDVFTRLVEAASGKNSPRHSLRGWLFRVARNELQRQYGRNNKIREVVLDEWLPASSDQDPELHFVTHKNLAQVRQAMRLLADEQQEVLVLRFGQALSLKETADLMDKSVGAIKQLQFRAVNTLRGILDEARIEPT